MSGATLDVVIVGAGTAGCVAASRLPEGARALLVDRRARLCGRCCGGLLSRDAQSALTRLGMRLPESARVEPSPAAVHVRDLDSGLAQVYRRSYLNVDRAAFDEWLLNLAGSRAEVRAGTRLVGISLSPDACEVRLSSAGREETVRARSVIGADGALSATRRLAFPASPGPQAMMAIQAAVPATGSMGSYEVFFSKRLTDFYAWAIPKGNVVLLGAAFGDIGAARARFASALAEMRSVLKLDGAELGRSARLLSRPRSAGELFPGSSRILLAGEAAGLVSPSSGEGLSFAIESGAAAGAALAAEAASAGGDALGGYLPAFRGLARRIRRKLIKARVIFSPLLRRVALRMPWCP